MRIDRPSTRLMLAVVATLLAVPASAATAEQLAGVVSTVDKDGKKIVLTPTGREKTVDVLINELTEIRTEAGKPIELKDLKAGDGLGIALNSGLASKIIVAVKPSELTGHVKSVGGTLKTFVVTETGTTTDVTVAITPETTIVSVKGEKLDLKGLKKGDGVGISHTNSVATHVVVNVKPIL